MAAVALIQFTQLPVIGTAGQALVGLTGTLVSVANDDNTDVASWQIDLVYTPPGSAVAISVPLAFNNNGSTPAASFTPDVDGPYRVVLKVWEVINRVGAATDTDIRIFLVPTTKHAFLIPPYQKDPDPRPTLASGATGAKPNEANVGGQEFGWDGRAQSGLVHDILKQLANSNFDIVPDIGSHVAGEVLGIARFESLYRPISTASDGSRVLVLNSNEDVGGTPGITRFDEGTQVFIDDNPGASTHLFLDITQTAGSQLWVLGVDDSTSDGILIGVQSTGTLVYDPPVVISPATPTLSFDFDGTFLWVSTFGGDLLKVDISGAPSVVDTIAIGSQLTLVRIDPDGSNYGDLAPRGFVLDYLALTVWRFTLGGLPATDDSLVIGATLRGLTVGTGSSAGFVFVATVDGDIHRLDVDPLAIDNTLSLAATYPDGVNSIDYDASTNTLWVTGENGDNIIVTTVDATALTVISSLSLETDAVNDTYGSGLLPRRIRFHSSYAWILDPRVTDLIDMGNAYVSNTTLPLAFEIVAPKSLDYQPVVTIPSGDLGGTTSVPLVTGIQGVPVTATPNASDILYYNGTLWNNTPRFLITNPGSFVTSGQTFNQYSPGGGSFDVVDVIEFHAAVGGQSLHGMITTTGVRRKTFINSGSNDITVLHQSGSAFASERFLCPGGVNLTVTPNMAFTACYSDLLAEWVVISTSTVTGSSSSFSNVITTVTPYNTLGTENAVGVNRASASTVNLTAPASAATLIVYDFSGNAGTTAPITISGGANSIGPYGTSYVINNPYGAVELLWPNSGTRWIIVNEFKPRSIITTSSATTNLSTSHSIVLVDSTTGARTVNLPASPREGEQHIIKDRDNNAATNNITIGRNGNTIDGLASNYIIGTNGGSVTLVWTNTASSSFGWRVV